MRYLCNLNIYITVEAATLIGLTFVAATSYVYRSVMAAKKKKGGVRKPTDPTTSAGDAVAAPKGADARGPAGAAPPAKEGDGRPETS